MDSNGQYVRSEPERELITGASFLRLFVAFEEFLEAAFGHYCTGGQSTAGWQPIRYAVPPSIEHAHRMFIGSQTFMDWSTPDKVRRLGKLYFEDGDPFEVPLASADLHLRDMKTVRNSSAHLSATTHSALDSLYGRWTGAPKAAVSVYEALNALEARGTITFLTRSEQTLQAIVTQISGRS